MGGERRLGATSVGEQLVLPEMEKRVEKDDELEAQKHFVLLD